MESIKSKMAKQTAQAAIAFEQRRTGKATRIGKPSASRRPDRCQSSGLGCGGQEYGRSSVGPRGHAIAFSGMRSEIVGQRRRGAATKISAIRLAAFSQGSKS